MARRYPRVSGSPAAKAQSRAAFSASGGFFPVIDAALGGVIESNLVTLTNVGSAVPLTISGGSYSKNGGAYSTTATTVSDGDTLRVRVTAPSTNSATATATVSVNGIARSFSVTTAAPSTGTPTLTLSATSPSIASSASAGTLVSNISNVPAGATPTVTPNDGRLVIAGDSSAGWKVVVGMSALSAGTVNFSVAAAGATGASGVLTVTAAAAPVLNSPTMFIGGASVEQFNDTGDSSNRFGHSPAGLLNWANMTGFTRLYDIVVRRNGALPYFATPSNFASSGAGFTTAGSRVSVTDQVPQLVAAMQAVPVGKRACYFSAGRNDLADGMTSAQYMAAYEPLFDQLAAVADLMIVPGLWKRAASTGGAWAAGGSARIATDEINALLADMVQRKGAKAVFLPLQDVMCDTTGNQDPKSGFTFEGIHPTPIGQQAAGIKARQILAPYFVPMVYPVLSTDYGLPLTGTAGALANGATGVVATGYTGSLDDANMAVAFSQPSAGVQRMAITSAVTQAANTGGGQLRIPVLNAVIGARYRSRCRVRIPATAKTISMAMYFSELTSGLTQRAVALWHLGGGAQPDTTFANNTNASSSRFVVPSEGLDLWLETPDLIIRATSGTPTIGVNLQVALVQGTVDTVIVDVSDWQIERLA